MSNGDFTDAENEAIQKAPVEVQLAYLVRTVGAIKATCEKRPAQCAASRSRTASSRRAIVAWAASLITGLGGLIIAVAALLGG